MASGSEGRALMSLLAKAIAGGRGGFLPQNQPGHDEEYAKKIREKRREMERSKKK